MLFQTGNMDDGCQNKGSMSTKSLFLLFLNRTGHMIFQEASRSGFLNQALVLIKDKQLCNSVYEQKGDRLLSQL